LRRWDCLRKGKDALKERIDTALADLMNDGIYATIADKYVDFDIRPQTATR